MEPDTQETIEAPEPEVKVVDLEVFREALRVQEVEAEWAALFERHGVDEETRVEIETATLACGLLKPKFYQRVLTLQRAKPWPGVFYAELSDFLSGFSLTKKAKRKPAGEKKPRTVKKKTIVDVVGELLGDSSEDPPAGESSVVVSTSLRRRVVLRSKADVIVEDPADVESEESTEGRTGNPETPAAPVESEEDRQLRERYLAAYTGEDQSTWGRVLYHALSGETTYENLASKVGLEVERVKRVLSTKYDIGWVHIESYGGRVVARLARSL